MCGIALIICGVRLELSSLSFDSTKDGFKSEQLVLSIDDIKAAVSRRGPDSVGSKKLFLQPNSSCPDAKRKIVSFIEGDEAIENTEYLGCLSSEMVDASNGQRDFVVASKCSALFHFIGATLQLRGTQQVVQPFLDGYKNILIYNGEIFGGLHVAGDENDGQVLMRTLENCCSCKSYLHKDECFCNRRGRVSIIDVLSNIKGPWAMIYWQDSTRTLWFGRDAFGRRSLLVHWPTMEDSRLLLSSVSPFPSVEQSSDENSANLRYWEELPCGIYSITLDAQNHDGVLVGSLQRHGWSNHMLAELVKWERAQVEPSSEQLYRSQSNTFSEQHDMQSALLEALPIESGSIQTSASLPALNVLNALRESVKRRSSLHSIFQAGTCHEEKELVPIAVLFSGGLDSMILAALLHECLDLRYEIDLLNVSFDSQSAPDRVTAKAGVTELRQIAPLRKWKLVEIDSHLSNLTCEMKHVMSLINPANTYMDLNIGIALWLASGGEGWLSEEHSNLFDGDYRCIKYKSKAKILLVGSGADEQCAGYGRHRTKYRNARWLGLNEEMKLDMQRIWKRNLGRDDRCIADNGKEARFPFLDEDVIKVLLDIPLWEIADLNQPSGAGDKKILREVPLPLKVFDVEIYIYHFSKVARLLGLYEAAALPKRAIQFGSRIARESNRKNFGSNRAANQASAGSVVIDIKSGLS